MKKIQALEFVETVDLLPEAGLLEESAVEAQFCCQKGLLVWIQCYSVLVSTLLLCYLDKVPELMAYMAMTVRCHWDYDSPL